MARVHWLGAGLSSVPGIRRLAAAGQALTLWNRTVSKAEAALAGIRSEAEARELDWEVLQDRVSAGDVVVSMLPASMHLKVAGVCLDRSAHFVSSSYVSPEMQQLHQAASSLGLSFLNEVGLDPGIDHLMAHALVEAYRSSPEFDASNEHYFRSYCGGLSQVPNDFCYKFSWSPLGVLKALKSKATWLGGGEIRTSDRPWKALSDYTIELPSGPEAFESYPNRDSLPFRSQYGFGDDWNVQEFVRGTLRLKGWAAAWDEIFRLVDSVEGAEGEAILKSKSDELWARHSFQDGERDRVVLSVELEVRRGCGTIWHEAYCVNEIGNERGSAMARLVSFTVSLGVESIMAGKIAPGVTAAPSEMELVRAWLAELSALGESIHHVTLKESIAE